ncbi:MAG: large conductance mechanosensitive channel protein MscL [Anaerolineae bacterium]|nr:large conductance mechanosensitive channel protein MscL [Phycisphaerae bacterium]
MLKEFKEFALKGNVVDLAVGVIIGAAFGALITSMVADVLMPPIGKIVGGLDFSNLYISLSDNVDAANTAMASTQPTAASSPRLPLDDAKKLGPVIAYGKFITGVINFLIVAFCVFLLIKLMNTAMRKFEKQQAAEAAAPAVPPADVQLLTEIRDLLKAGR